MQRSKKSHQPLISIIMNCHNGEKYLKKSLKSVLNQSYKNWELIFLDNKSKDKSKSILKKFLNKRIKYFSTSKFLSLYDARNLAIKKAKGEYISFLDTDDWWIKDKIKKQLSFFNKDKNLDIVYSNLYLYDNLKKKPVIYSKKKLYQGHITQQLLNDFKMSILTTMIKKKFFNKNKFDKRYNIIGDFDLFVRMSIKNKIGVIQEPLAYYRLHKNNLSLKKVDLNVNELKNWLLEKSKKKVFKSFDLSKVREKTQLLEIKHLLIENKKTLAFNQIFTKPVFISKYKFLLLILLPNKLIKNLFGLT